MKKSQDIGVGQREFARQLGKSLSWVQYRLKKGEIPVNADGTIPLEAGIAAFNKFVEEKEKKAQAKGKALAKTEPASVTFGCETIETPSHEKPLDAKKVAQLFALAKMREKEAVAKLKALELQEKEGMLVPMDEAMAVIDDLASMVREKMLTIPVRYGSLLEGRNQREIEAVLEDAIDEVLRCFQDTKYAKAKKAVE